jgi:flagellar protein FlgJ
MEISAVNSFQYLGQSEQTSFQQISSRLLRERQYGADNASTRTAAVRSISSPELPTEEHSKLYEACLDFEALFIKQMLNAMRKTVNKTHLIDGGMAEEIFEDMLYDEYAKKMARTAQFGLADMLYRDLSPQIGLEAVPSAAAAAAYQRGQGT